MNEDKKAVLKDLLEYANAKKNKEQPENTPTEEKEWKPCSLGAEKRKDGGIEIEVRGGAGDLMCLAAAICNSLYHTLEEQEDDTALLVFKLLIKKVMQGGFKPDGTREYLSGED